jgi:hypothetical protein
MAEQIKTIKELKKKFPTGKGLTVQLDNDTTGAYIEADGEDADSIFNGNGYSDMRELWEELFPEADIDWC